jgi:hypothetical protein
MVEECIYILCFGVCGLRSYRLLLSFFVEEDVFRSLYVPYVPVLESGYREGAYVG